jgi:hypothetical protein
MSQVENVGVESKIEEQEREESTENKSDHVAGAEMGEARFGRLVRRAEAVDRAQDDRLDADGVVRRPPPRPPVHVYVVLGPML